MLKTLCLALPLLAALLSGCSAEDGSSASADVQPTPFVGRVDERLVGAWKTENGASTYQLEKSGGYRLRAKIKTPGGSMDTDSAGSWLVDGDLFLMKDAAGNVAKYKMALKGDRLTLSTTGSLKRDLTLIKQ